MVRHAPRNQRTRNLSRWSLGEIPTCGLVDIFKPWEMDVHLCGEHLQIIRLTESATHSAKP